MKMSSFQADFTKWVSNEWVQNALILVALYIVLILVSGFLKRRINKKFSGANVKLKLRSAVSAISTVIWIFFALILFSNKLSGLTVALGVAGAGIAFALQEVIASLAGWFAVHFGSFYSVGDRVSIGGTTGDVIEVGLLRTTLMELGQWVKGDQYNGRVVRVANSFVFKEPVVNYSADFPFLWDEISIPIKHGSDLQKTSQLFKSIADKYFKTYEKGAEEKWKKLVEKYVIENARIENQIFIAADENFITFSVRYVTDLKKRRLVKTDLFTRMLHAIDENEEFVSLAGATIDITGSKDFFKLLEKRC